MFQFSFLLLLSVLPAAFNQFITFKDGKLGVNFAGFTADVGLGGLLTGDAAHGGLSASAGTPYGQRAGAGLGGTVDNGRTRGGLYAGATAGNGIGASAALGGNVDETGAAGGKGAEAHAAGFSTKTVRLSQTPQAPEAPQPLPFFSLPAPQQQNTIASAGSIGLRSSFGNSPQPSIAPQVPPITYGRRYYKRKEIRRLNRAKNKVVQLDQRFDVPQQQNYAPQPQNNLDYTKFFDFGFFSNAAASFSGAPHPASQQDGRVFSYQKQITPNTIELHKTVVPSYLFPMLQPKAPEAKKVDARNDSDELDFSEEETDEKPVVTKTKTKSKTIRATTKQLQPNPNFFNDIFNIPISTLGAVSQFLSNGAANGGVAVSKTKTVEVS